MHIKTHIKMHIKTHIIILHMYNMFFLVDNARKILFGWSAKCGCSHIKRIFYFLKYNNENTIIHGCKDYNKLPDDIDKYTTIIISRNPYERIISGFLDKYKSGGSFRHLWKYGTITFAKFVEETVKGDWNMVEKHHFTPQTTEKFNENIMLSKCIKCYDIKNIDYNYIEELYNVKIPKTILTKKEGHERKNYGESIDHCVYDLEMAEYYNFDVNIKYFYNEELKNKIYNFYKNDFIFFSELGVEYTTPGS
jgi:hypothetical protein